MMADFLRKKHRHLTRNFSSAFWLEFVFADIWREQRSRQPPSLERELLKQTRVGQGGGEQRCGERKAGGEEDTTVINEFKEKETVVSSWWSWARWSPSTIRGKDIKLGGGFENRKEGVGGSFPKNPRREIRGVQGLWKVSYDTSVDNVSYHLVHIKLNI